MPISSRRIYLGYNLICSEDYPKAYDSSNTLMTNYQSVGYAQYEFAFDSASVYTVSCGRMAAYTATVSNTP